MWQRELFQIERDLGSPMGEAVGKDHQAYSVMQAPLSAVEAKAFSKGRGPCGGKVVCVCVCVCLCYYFGSAEKMELKREVGSPMGQ